MSEDFLEIVREKARHKLLFVPHAVRQMNHPERMITTSEVRRVVFEGKIIEDYPEDSRGHSCLMLGFGDEGRPLHIVCAPKDEYLAIITAYVPSEHEWNEGYRSRRKK